MLQPLDLERGDKMLAEVSRREKALR